LKFHEQKYPSGVDEFLRDLAKWINSEHGFTVPPSNKVRVGHFSRFLVRPDKDLACLDSRLLEFGKFISSRVSSADGQSRDFQLSGLRFWANDLGKTGAPGGFLFERKIGSPFQEQRYIAEGPFTTDALLEVIEELERLLT
jgi:hypothetical protein